MLEVLQDELAQKQRQLEQLEAEYRGFAYAVSHDLSGPLRSIQGFTTFIAEDHAETLDVRSLKHLNRIIESSQKAKIMLDSLLEFSRLNTAPDSVECVDCNTLVAETIKDLSDPVMASDAQIFVSSLPVISAVPEQLSTVFREVLKNAVIYHAPGARPEISITSVQTDHQWKFAIKDNGIGVRPSAHEKVFNVLKRMVKEKDYPGMGMGLAIARKIVRSHGGDIWITNEQEQGVTVCLTIAKGARIG